MKNEIKTLNSLSGGKTSSFMALNYPTDFNVFALVTTIDKNCLFPDPQIRKIVSDKINREFIGTLEQNEIIFTMLDLEQLIGKKIDWVVGESFDAIIKNKNGFFLPNVFNRFCTYQMKIEPIKRFWMEKIGTPIETQIGFRANEMKRANNMLERCESDGFIYDKFIVGKHENGKNKWKKMKYQKPKFPLIENRVFKDSIEKFWIGKNIRFAKMNNCVGCFHRNEILLKHMSHIEPQKFQWFIDAEKKSITGSFKKNITYQQIKNHRLQFDLFDDDFNECDSGHCGL